jgi:signal transduction histidine kinase
MGLNWPFRSRKDFDKFVQVNRKKKQIGTGLGLSIVKQLFGPFDSDITLQSSVGKGTEFNQFVIAFEHNMERTEIINNIQVKLVQHKWYILVVG